MALGLLWWRAWARRATLHCLFAWSLCHFAWQEWRVWHWAGSGGALGRALVARGAAPLCMAGVALGDIYLRFAWHAWHLVTSTFTLRGRRGAWCYLLSFCVASVALRALLGSIWWCASACFSPLGRRATLHGRRGTW